MDRFILEMWAKVEGRDHVSVVFASKYFITYNEFQDVVGFSWDGDHGIQQLHFTETYEVVVRDIKFDDLVTYELKLEE